MKSLVLIAPELFLSAVALLIILGDTLDLSKIEAGRLKLVTAPFDPAACVAGVVRLFEKTARDKGLMLEMVPSRIPECVVGDEGLL